MPIKKSFKTIKIFSLWILTYKLFHSFGTAVKKARWPTLANFVNWESHTFWVTDEVRT